MTWEVDAQGTWTAMLGQWRANVSRNSDTGGWNYKQWQFFVDPAPQRPHAPSAMGWAESEHQARKVAEDYVAHFIQEYGG